MIVSIINHRAKEFENVLLDGVGFLIMWKDLSHTLYLYVFIALVCIPCFYYLSIFWTTICIQQSHIMLKGCLKNSAHLMLVTSYFFV